MSIILNTDSYKASHWLQYPPGTRFVSSYIEARGIASDAPVPSENLEIVHFGLQMFLKEYLTKRITRADCDEALDIFNRHGEPINYQGWHDIVFKHDGKLPVRIQALPEGTIIRPGVAQVQITNTDEDFAWLTSYLETALLRAVWYPSTVATISREMKKLILKYLERTSDDPKGQIDFKLHDFGARGVSSNESAGIGGLAHLVNFRGTDTVAALLAARRYYGESMAGFSIPAAEHSTITSWGREHESAAYRNMLQQFGGEGKLVAVVSDSYDIYNAASNIWGKELKKEVLDSGATVVIRPDSGNPTVVVLSLLNILGERFGFTENKKGFKVLHPSVRIIQGDGVEYSSVEDILREMWAQGWSAENVAFGMGGALLQKVNRDTFKYAMKANAIMDYSDTWKDVYKEPATDKGKASKKGRLAVVDNAGKLITIREDNLLYDTNLLEDVYLNGEIKKEWTLDDVRTAASV